jgi:hypothetical protein
VSTKLAPAASPGVAAAAVVMDFLRTHPLVIMGGLLHENPFFVPPEAFLSELRRRRVCASLG